MRKKIIGWIKIVWEFLKIAGGIILLIIGFKMFHDLFKPDKKKSDKKIVEKKKEIKNLKSTAENNRKKAEVLKKKAAIKNRDRKSVRDKYSNIVPFIVGLLLLFFLKPSPVFCRYIVWDAEDKVNRDYGTITNYVRSLEEEKIIFLAVHGHLNTAFSYYSNAYTCLSNASSKQNEIIEEIEPAWYEVVWDEAKFWVGAASGVVVGWLVFR